MNDRKKAKDVSRNKHDKIPDGFWEHKLKLKLLTLCIFLQMIVFVRVGYAISIKEGGSWELKSSGIMIKGEDLFPGKSSVKIYNNLFSEVLKIDEEIIEINTNEYFEVLAMSYDNNWILISYQDGDNHHRFCWTKKPDGVYEKEYWWCVNSNNGEERIKEIRLYRNYGEILQDCCLKNAPGEKQKIIGNLQQGDQVIQLCHSKIDGEVWEYVEVEIDDKIVWGFVQDNLINSNPRSLYQIEENTLVFKEGVSMIGTDYVYEYPELEPGDIWINQIDLISSAPAEEVRNIQFPRTLKILGHKALEYGTLETISLSGLPFVVEEDALYCCNVDKIIIEKDYKQGILFGERNNIRAWEAEEGNPMYSSQDGVLFSADRKILYSYPNGKGGLHYDVPAGTEIIASKAFYDEYSEIVLQSISLPLGLKRIENNAFSGCGRLLSLTIPLTVTSVSFDAFDECINLERVSMPAHIRAAFEENWRQEWEEWYGVEYGRDWRSDEEKLLDSLVWFKGDNGKNTIYHAYDEEDDYTAWVSGENGTGEIPIYERWEGDIIKDYIISGTEVYVSCEDPINGRVYSEQGWVNKENILPRTNYFFHLTRIEPNEEGKRILKQQGFKSLDINGTLRYRGTYCEFEEYNQEEEKWIYAQLELTQVVFKRANNDDQRKLAMLVSEDPLEPIRILNMPDGQQLAWTYSKDQAEVLEVIGKWCKIRTARAEGWVPSSKVKVVPQESMRVD